MEQFVLPVKKRLFSAGMGDERSGIGGNYPGDICGLSLDKGGEERDSDEGDASGYHNYGNIYGDKLKKGMITIAKQKKSYYINNVINFSKKQKS